MRWPGADASHSTLRERLDTAPQFCGLKHRSWPRTGAGPDDGEPLPPPAEKHDLGRRSGTSPQKE